MISKAKRCIAAIGRDCTLLKQVLCKRADGSNIFKRVELRVACVQLTVTIYKGYINTSLLKVIYLSFAGNARHL